jgi:hypothetical protein
MSVVVDWSKSHKVGNVPEREPKPFVTKISGVGFSLFCHGEMCEAALAQDVDSTVTPRSELFSWQYANLNTTACCFIA